MAKMYYNLEEAMAKLGCTEQQLKGWVREGKLREFRDAGKLNYRVEEVDAVVGQIAGSSPSPADSGPLALEDSGEIPLAPDEDATPKAPGTSKDRLSDSGVVRELGSSGEQVDLSLDSGPLGLQGDSGEFKLDGSGSGSGTGIGTGTGTGSLSLEDSGGGSGGGKRGGSGAPPAAPSPGDSKSGTRPGGDIVSLDEVDKDAVEGMKKDDTVITNIGISVFDDDDLEIAADPMAKTLMTGGDEHLGLDGSGGGSGLLDLTRESDDTSLGAELLEGIDMGDTAETEAAVARAPAAASSGEETSPLPEPEEIPLVAATVPVSMGGVVEAASPAYTGLLVAGALALWLLAATNVALSLDAWPAYLAFLSEQFWFVLGGGLVLLGLFALAGWLIGKQGSAPRAPKKPKPKKEPKGKAKGKGPPVADPGAELESDALEMPG